MHNDESRQAPVPITGQVLRWAEACIVRRHADHAKYLLAGLAPTADSCAKTLCLHGGFGESRDDPPTCLDRNKPPGGYSRITALSRAAVPGGPWAHDYSADTLSDPISGIATTCVRKTLSSSPDPARTTSSRMRVVERLCAGSMRGRGAVRALDGRTLGLPIQSPGGQVAEGIRRRNPFCPNRVPRLVSPSPRGTFTECT